MSPRTFVQATQKLALTSHNTTAQGNSFKNLYIVSNRLSLDRKPKRWEEQKKKEKEEMVEEGEEEKR